MPGTVSDPTAVAGWGRIRLWVWRSERRKHRRGPTFGLVYMETRRNHQRVVARGRTSQWDGTGRMKRISTPQKTRASDIYSTTTLFHSHAAGHKVSSDRILSHILSFPRALAGIASLSARANTARSRSLALGQGVVKSVSKRHAAGADSCPCVPGYRSTTIISKSVVGKRSAKRGDLPRESHPRIHK
jgi:hypothetical protein